MAEVVADGLKTFDGGLPDELPLGVTFSFPMMLVQIVPGRCS